MRGEFSLCYKPLTTACAEPLPREKPLAKRNCKEIYSRESNSNHSTNQNLKYGSLFYVVLEGDIGAADVFIVLGIDSVSDIF